MLNPYKPTTEVEEGEEGDPSKRGPMIGAVAAVVFLLIGLSSLLSGGFVEGGGALIVALTCWASSQ